MEHSQSISPQKGPSIQRIKRTLLRAMFFKITFFNFIFSKIKFVYGSQVVSVFPDFQSTNKPIHCFSSMVFCPWFFYQSVNWPHAWHIITSGGVGVHARLNFYHFGRWTCPWYLDTCTWWILFEAACMTPISSDPLLKKYSLPEKSYLSRPNMKRK